MCVRLHVQLPLPCYLLPRSFCFTPCPCSLPLAHPPHSVKVDNEALCWWALCSVQQDQLTLCTLWIAVSAGGGALIFGNLTIELCRRGTNKKTRQWPWRDNDLQDYCKEHLWKYLNNEQTKLKILEGSQSGSVKELQMLASSLHI